MIFYISKKIVSCNPVFVKELKLGYTIEEEYFIFKN